jgi:hypothetical protein
LFYGNYIVSQTNAPPTGIRKTRFPGVLRYPKFTVLWLSEAVSLTGDRILMVALISMVYQQTHSASSIGLLSMIKALPALILATIAGISIFRLQARELNSKSDSK